MFTMYTSLVGCASKAYSLLTFVYTVPPCVNFVYSQLWLIGEKEHNAAVSVAGYCTILGKRRQHLVSHAQLK